MAAPAATVRGTPDGIALVTGFGAKVTFSGDATIELWEKGVTPPGIDAGDAINTTTHHNATWETYRAKTLKKLTASPFRATYDPDVLDELTSLVGDDTQTITITYADGTTDAFFGFLQKVEFDEMADNNEPPMGTFTIHPTNWDTANNVEAGRTLVEVEGT